MAIVNIILGLVLLTAGATMLVSGATNVARSLGVSEVVIGLTIVALGTSMPEFFALVISTAKGSSGIGLGNIIGSNILNIVGVLGLGLILVPVTIERAEMDWVTVGAFCASNLYLLLAMLFRGSLTRVDGAILLAAFVAFTWLSYTKSPRSTIAPTSPDASARAESESGAHVV